ncbi:MAG: hypothetical protein IKR23_04945 [Lachnospiraceae bacterium]|nr:hypothetical protein [Lachnospiraceae bacterium]
MKKKLLAGLLSFTMLTGQMLPVVAADDADVTVSEDAVIAEEETEAEAAEEETAEEAVEVEEIGSPIAYEEEVVSEEDGEEVSEYSAYYLVKVGEDGAVEDVDVEDAALDQAAANHIYAVERVGHKVDASTFDVNGTSVVVDATFSYYGYISYRAKKIKPVEDLEVKVESSGLYSVAQALATPGTAVSQDLFKWKYSAKKNEKANSGSYFTVKASVNSKVAKQMGIKGKSLKTLKKAVKQFNKVAKKDQIPFIIDPVNFDYMASNGYAIVVEKGIITRRFGMIISRKFTGIELRCRIKPEQPESVTDSTLKKWTKPSKKDITIKKVEGKTYSITINNLNYWSQVGSFTYTAHLW